MFGRFLREPETWCGLAQVSQVHRPQHIAAEPPANVAPIAAEAKIIFSTACGRFRQPEKHEERNPERILSARACCCGDQEPGNSDLKGASR